MQFWKSNKMHWCDICRCWMNDQKQAIQNHERGMGHQEALKRSECTEGVSDALHEALDAAWGRPGCPSDAACT